MEQESRQIYTVVEVVHGITDTVHHFKQLKDAQRFFKIIKKKHNPDEDDVQMFESAVSE